MLELVRELKLNLIIRLTKWLNKNLILTFGTGVNLKEISLLE